MNALSENEVMRTPFLGEFKLKKAFITGITGQDGSYLAELLLSKGVRSARRYPQSKHLQHPQN